MPGFVLSLPYKKNYMEDFEQKKDTQPLVDFGPVEDKSKGIIKVIGIG